MNDHPEWNESYYFNFHDEKNDTTVFMRIGNKPNKNEKSMFMFVMRDGLVAGMRNSGVCDDDKWFSSGLRFEGSGDSWHITYDGPIMDPKTMSPHTFSMDVQWVSYNPMMNYRDCVDQRGEEMSKNVASEHFEQFGHVTGRMIIDGSELAIDAYGERDMSEGVREWGSPKMWMWINSVYDGMYGYNITKLCVEQGDVDAGYFYDGKVNHPLNKADIDVEYEGAVPTSFTMSLKDKTGNSYDVNGEVIRYAMLPFPGSKEMLLIETISKTVWNGKIGYGIAEFLVPMKR